MGDNLNGYKMLPKKRRHTAKKFFERLLVDDYEGGQTQNMEVLEFKRQRLEVFVPLLSRPGEAQVVVGFSTSIPSMIYQEGVIRRKVAECFSTLREKPIFSIRLVVASWKECDGRP